MGDVTLRKMSYFDILRMWVWRNDNSEYFVHKDFIPLRSHIVWFTKWWLRRLNTNKNHMFIVEYLGIPVGMLGIDIEKGDWAGTIQRVVLANKKLSRTGVMGRALEELIEMFPLHLYKLEVLSDNTRAINFYKKHGFSIDPESSDEEVYRMKRYESNKSSSTLLH